MDQWWNKLPLFVIFLLLGKASGFKGGPYSNAHHQWGQPSDNAFSPRAVQSSVSEVPVSGILPEVGSSLFTNRPLKSLNFLKFVKGGVSNRLESMSYAQTAPSISSQGESTSFPAVLGTSDLSTSNQSSPSLYMSSSQETSGAKSMEANLPVISQGSVLYNSSSASGATYNSEGSPVPLSEGSGQSISPQGESSYSGPSRSQGASDTPDSSNKLSSSSVSSQSTSDQSTPSLYSLSSQSSSGNLLEASGSSFQVDLSPQSQETSNQLLPSPLEVTSQSSNGQSTPSLFMVNTDSQSTGLASPPDIQSRLSQSILSTLTQGSASTSQGSSGPELSGSSGQLIPTQVERGSYRGVSQSLSTSSRHAPGSLMYSNFGALPVGVSSQYTRVQSSPSVSTSTQSRSSTQLTSSNFFPVKGGSHSTSTLSLKPPGIMGMYAPASSAKYVSFPMSSHQTVYHSSGAQFGTYTGSASQGTSSTYSGSVKPKGTTSQFAPGSPSSYPSVSLSSPQGAASQFATVQSSQKQFTSRYGTVSVSSTPFSLQGSTTYGGSLQPQATTSQFASGSPSSYPSLSPSSPQGATGQSAAVQSSRKQFTSRYGILSGSSTPFSLLGSTTYGGSLQPQGTKSQFASGSPSSYPSVSLSSPQDAVVQSSRKQFTSSYGIVSGSSTPFSLQGSTTYDGSLQPQGTTSQFASGSPSSYPSSSPSSPQGAAGQSATVQSSQKHFTSSYGTLSGSSTPFSLQGSTTYGGAIKPQGTTSQFASRSSFSYPSVSLSSAHGAVSQSATVQSSRKQFTSSYGTVSGSSTPFSFGGSLKPQAATSQFASGSPSSPQGPAGQSAAVQSSRKQFTSSYDTVSGSSTPFSLEGSTTYSGSPKTQATSSQFSPASPFSYNCNCVSLSSPQDVTSVSATVQSLQKQFTSSYGLHSQSGSSTPFSLQGTTTYGRSLQPQATTSQFAPASPSYNCHCASLSLPQDVASQSNQASQRWKLLQGIQTSGAVASQGSYLSQSSPMQSRFSSLSSAGGSSDSGPFVSAQDGSTSYGGLSQRLSSKYTPESHAYAKLGSSPLSVSSQSTSNLRSNDLYSSDSLRTQGRFGVVKLSSQAPSDSPISKKISERFVPLQRLTGSTRAPFLGLSSQASSVGVFSGIPQTAEALRKSGSDVQLYNQLLLKPLLRQGLRASTKTAS